MIKIKRDHYSKSLTVLLIFIDCVLLTLSYKAAFWIEFKSAFIPAGHYQALLAVSLLGWIVASLFSNAYHPDKLKSFTRISKSTFRTFALYVLILLGYFAFFNAFETSTDFILSVQSLFLLFSIGIKFGLLKFYALIRNSEQNRSRTIIVGYTNAGKELYRYFKSSKTSGFEFLGFFDDNHQNKLISGKLEDVREFCIRNNVREIYYALPNDEKLINELTEFADDNFIHFGLVQDLSGLSYDKLQAVNYDNRIPVISGTRTHMRKGLSGKLYSDLYLKVKNHAFQ